MSLILPIYVLIILLAIASLVNIFILIKSNCEAVAIRSLAKQIR